MRHRFNFGLSVLFAGAQSQSQSICEHTPSFCDGTLRQQHPALVETRPHRHDTDTTLPVLAASHAVPQRQFALRHAAYRDRPPHIAQNLYLSAISSRHASHRAPLINPPNNGCWLTIARSSPPASPRPHHAAARLHQRLQLPGADPPSELRGQPRFRPPATAVTAVTAVTAFSSAALPPQTPSAGARLLSVSAPSPAPR